MKQNGNGHKSIQLPDAFVPMLAGNPDGFIARMEGRRLILEPKPSAKRGSGRTTKTVLAPTTDVAGRRKGSPVSEASARPTFLYTVKDRRLSLESAKRYGLSPTRLKVLQAVYKAKKGLKAADIMARCKLPHGSVQQTLHWLRTHEMIDGHPITL